MKTSSIYPGGIFLKRLKHLFAFSFIGLNLFLGRIEHELLIMAERVSDDSIDSAQYGIAYSQQLIRSKLSNMDYLVPGTPVQDATTKLSDVGELLQTVQETIDRYFSLIVLFGWVRNLYWISLIYPAFWLICDWRLGHVKKMLRGAFIGLIVFNFASGLLLWLSTDKIITWMSGLAKT